MNKILVPTDFSDASQFAIDVAIALGEKTNAELILFHGSIPNEGLNNNVYSAIFIHEYHAVKIQNLENLSSKIREAGYKGTITIDHQIGFIVNGIIEAAKNHDVDLIVMGATGTGFLEGMLIGSSTGGVMARSEIPVFIVPKNYKISQDEGTLVIGTDFHTGLNPKSKETLEFFRQSLGYKSILAHITEEGEKIDQPAYLQANFSSPPDEVVILENEKVSNALLELNTHYTNPILCTIRKSRNWFESLFSRSVSKSLSLKADLAMIAFQD